MQKAVFYCFHPSMHIISQHSKQQSGMLHKESIGAFCTVWPSHLSQVSEQAVAGTGGDCGCIWVSHSLPCAICSSLLLQVPYRGQQRSRISIRLVWYLSSFRAISLAFRQTYFLHSIPPHVGLSSQLQDTSFLMGQDGAGGGLPFSSLLDEFFTEKS